MINKRNLISSVKLSLLQVGISAVTLLLLYKFLLKEIGVESIGIWAIVLSATSVARIADLGMSASVVRFVSKHLAVHNTTAAGRVVETSTLAIGGMVGAALAFCYPVIVSALAFAVEPNALSQAMPLLPFALMSLWLSTVAGIFQSGLDGCQRVDLRSAIVTAGSIFYFIAALFAVSQFGLMGLAYAQLSQTLLVLVVSWVVLRRVLPSLPVFPTRINGSAFRESWKYSVNFQLASLLSMLIDPLTKVLIGKFGGVGLVGYHDMAVRMTSQFRSLLVASNQVSVPIVSRLNEVAPEHVRPAYQISYRLVVFLAFPGYACLFAMIPAISEIWIGRYESDFVSIAMAVTVGTFLNSFVNPAYFANLGEGQLRWNTYGFAVMALANIGLGYPLGVAYGGMGVVIASVLAFVVGSWIILISYHRRHEIPMLDILPPESAGLALASLSAAGAGLAIFYGIGSEKEDVARAALSALGAYAAVVAYPMWRHPVRKQLSHWVSER